MTLNQLDLLNVDELLELARDNVLSVDGYNMSEIVMKVANQEYEKGYDDGYQTSKMLYDDYA